VRSVSITAKKGLFCFHCLKLEQKIKMDLSENDKSKRAHARQKEKVKIHYRQKVKLKQRASVWVRLKKYVGKNRKMLTVSILLVVGLIIAMTSIFLTVKQKSDRHKDLMEQKFTAPAS
jgi:hypothetical protein